MSMVNEEKDWRRTCTRDTRLLHDRLVSEGERELAQKINVCGKEIHLICVNCATKTLGHQRCKRKWCPYCSRVLAAKRSAELKYIVRRFQWPLFVTLTMRNVPDLSSDAVRTLRRSFGKIRHRKFWKSNVTAGIACMEVTNIGNGWHPHLHTVLDCAWLSVRTRRPSSGDSSDVKKNLFRDAGIELERNWSKCLGQESSSVKVKRCSSETITKEVVKYAVKGSDLLGVEEPIGDVIRCIERTRLLTTFGSAHGQCVKDLRAEARAEAEATASQKNKPDTAPSESPNKFDVSCPCCPAPFILPDQVGYNKRLFEKAQRTDTSGRPQWRYLREVA